MSAWPRDVEPVRVSRPVLPRALRSVSQRGKIQQRNTGQMGWAWTESYPDLRARRAADQKLLAFADRQWNRGLFFWLDHPLTPGSGLPLLGAGRENLIRDAAMDTDTDADGVVDGFDGRGPFNGGSAAVTFSLDGARGAQQMDLTRGGADYVADVQQWALRVFEGDVITFSVEAETADGTGVGEARLLMFWRDDAGASLGFVALAPQGSVGSFTRLVLTGTAPAGTRHVSVECRGHVSGADGETGTVWYRDARLLRASADPATWSNPHVSGASQTGETLTTSGWPASTTGVLKAGDFFRIGGSGDTKANAEADEFAPAFKVTADADSDGNGDATVEIVPAIFAGGSPPDGAALRFEKMRLRATLLNQPNVLRTAEVDLYRGMELGFREGV